MTDLGKFYELIDRVKSAKRIYADKYHSAVEAKTVADSAFDSMREAERVLHKHLTDLLASDVEEVTLPPPDIDHSEPPQRPSEPQTGTRSAGSVASGDDAPEKP